MIDIFEKLILVIKPGKLLKPRPSLNSIRLSDTKHMCTRHFCFNISGFHCPSGLKVCTDGFDIRRTKTIQTFERPYIRRQDTRGTFLKSCKNPNIVVNND